MRVPAGSLSLVCLLAALPFAAGAAERLAVFVAYDPAAPLDPNRSYACEALAPDDASYDAHRAGRLPLDCRRIPLADLCGTVGSGDAEALDPDCHLLPVAGRAPTDAQVRQFADGLEAYFKGNLPKLNFTLLEMSRRPGAGFQANLRAGPTGASPAVGAWDGAAPAERVALATPLLTVDPAQPDTRYGNGWQNPHGSEWGGYLSKRTLDEVASDVRRALATPENPVPSAAAVASRASEEVARCRGSSVDALRADLRSHVARMAGRAAPRPALDLPGNCAVDAAPALVLPPPPPPREWTATKPCGSGARTFTSTVSQADADRKAREFRCPTWTASACGDTFTSGVSQADANRMAANRRPCTYTASKTCGSRTRHFTSSVSQAAAAAKARAWSCPVVPPPPPREWTARACGQTVTSYVSQADADRKAGELDCSGTGTSRATGRVSTPRPRVSTPDPRTYTARKNCGSGAEVFESTVSQADANRKARNHVCPTWTASACGDTFTSGVSQADANRMAANRRPCTYIAYKSCPSGRQRFTSSVSQADADGKAARATCPSWTARQCEETFTSYVGQPDANRMAAEALPCGSVTKSCPSGRSKTFTSNISQADAQAQANRWSCPTWKVTKSCPSGAPKTFTSDVSPADAQAQANRWKCPVPPPPPPPTPVYTARDCKGEEWRSNRSQADANSIAAQVKCPVSRPAIQRDVHGELEGVRDGECDSSDPGCGGLRDPDTFDETSRTHRVARGGAGTSSVRRAPTRTYYAYRTCGSSRKTFSSTVSQYAANRLANAYRCPVRASSTPRASYKLCNGRYVYVVSCPASGSGSAAAPRRVMMCNGRYVYASSCAGR